MARKSKIKKGAEYSTRINLELERSEVPQSGIELRTYIFAIVTRGRARSFTVKRGTLGYFL